jgi:hypothetical protein
MTAMLAVVRGLGLYLLLCLAATLAGYGLLRLCRLRVGRRAQLILAPLVALVGWTLALGIPAALRLPLRSICPWVWGATLLLVILGLANRPQRLFCRQTLLPWLVCLLVPLVVLARPVKHGLGDCLDCMNMDGWFYVTGGHYIDAWGRLPYQGSDPLLQLGSCFREHRFITFCLISHFSNLISPGDTQAAGGLFQAWALFTMACAVALFWQARSHRLGIVLVGTTLTIVAGWTAQVVWGNWYEQELALAYMPALAAALYLWPAGDWRRWAALGALTAGLLYTYPEAAVVPLGGVGLIAACRLWRERARWRAWLAGSAFAVVLAALLLAPALPTLIAFTRGQNNSVYTHGMDGVRWLVGGLADWHCHPSAFWGLGGETFAKPATAACNLLGTALTVLSVAGMFVLARRGEWGIAAAAGALAAAALAWLVLLEHPYITFKTLIIVWWILFYVAAAGAGWTMMHIPAMPARRYLGAVGVAVVLGQGLWVTQKREPLGTSRYPELHLYDYRALKELPALVEGQTVFVHVHDWLASQLALGMLHEQSLYLAAPRGWYAGPGVIQSRKTQPPALDPETSLVLTDLEYDTCRVSDLPQCGQVVWAGGPYMLWRLDSQQVPPAALLDIDPLVTDVMDGTAGKTFWVGHEPITLHVRARTAGTLLVAADACFGDGAEHGRRHLTIATDAGLIDQVEVAPGSGLIEIPVHAGINRLVLDCPDPPPAAGRVPGIAHRYILCLREAHLTLVLPRTGVPHIGYQTEGRCACVSSSTP